MSKSDLKRLGDYIREVDVRNTELAITKLYGVNLNKEFMPSVANIIGTDLTKYKVISYNQFGCKLMSVERDKKMPISLMKEVEPAIMSSAYFVFEVKDEDILMPDYLFLQIKNPEFDRRLWFSSGGDVRGGVGFNNLEEMPILVPPLEEQRKIVERHKAIQQRIEINRKTIAKLEEAAQAIYRKMFVDDVDPEHLPEGMYSTTILDFCKEIKSGGTPNRLISEYWSSRDYPWLKTGEVQNCVVNDTEEYISEAGLRNSSAKVITKGSVVMAMYGATAAQVAFLNCDTTTNQACCNMTCHTLEEAAFLYFHLRYHQENIKRLANGGAQENLSKELIANQPIILYSDKPSSPIFLKLLNHIIVLHSQTEKLSKLQASI